MRFANERRRSRNAGFSLIELVMVVAIILIIAAIAIPNFLKSKQRANETSAVASLRAIATTEVTYQTTYQRGYSPDLQSLGPPVGGGNPSATSADLIDSVLASGIKSGYAIVYAAIDADGNGQPDAFTVNGNPVSPGQTGEKYFYVDQTGVVRYNLGAPAGPTSDPVPSK